MYYLYLFTLVLMNQLSRSTVYPNNVEILSQNSDLGLSNSYDTQRNDHIKWNTIYRPSPPTNKMAAGGLQRIPLYDIGDRVDPYATDESFCGVRDVFRGSGRKRNRSKRSVIQDLKINALVVTDPTVTTYYKDQDLEIYIYALIDMVNQIYHHYTLGYSIEVRVSSIVMLESKPPTLDITSNADVYLKSFCAWQMDRLKGNDSSGFRVNPYNTAILITRKDICANNDTPCGTLGLAEVGAICQTERSCSIAEDTGLSTAFTIAHELGHLFGMKHDTTDNCNSLNINNQHARPYIMAPRLPQNLLTELLWSNCSRKDATIFIERRFAKCLTATSPPDMPPSPVPGENFLRRVDQFIDLDIDVRVDNDSTNATHDDGDNGAIEILMDAPDETSVNLIKKILSPIITNFSDLSQDHDPKSLKDKLSRALKDMLKTYPTLRSRDITVRGIVFAGHPNKWFQNYSAGDVVVADVPPGIDLYNISNVINIDPSDNDLVSLISYLPTGAIFSMDVQCQLLFGMPNVTYCPGIDEVCNQLWCRVGHKCMSKMRIPEDGTPCGVNKWCMSKRCVPIYYTDLSEVKGTRRDGNWGKWSLWSKCSRNCGTGVSFAFRMCDNPRPENGGKFCLGAQRKYKTCNNQLCPDWVDIRDSQCQKYGCQVQGKCHLNWTFDVLQASFAPQTLCLLYCTSDEGQNLLGYEAVPNLEDGSPCQSRDLAKDYQKNVEGGICIEGVCHPLGCDNQINSFAERDACGVCNGQNDSCVTVVGNLTATNYNASQVVESSWGGGRYIPLGLLPPGSLAIRLTEVNPSPNFIALALDPTRPVFLLNGNNTISWNGAHTQLGISYTYKREADERESVEIRGPLKDKLIVYHLALAGLPTDDDAINYTYKVPTKTDRRSVNSTRQTIGKGSTEVTWFINDWTPCTKTCGNGTQKPELACKVVRDDGDALPVLIETGWCDDVPKPVNIVKSRRCNEAPCPPFWWTADWQPCPITCGLKAFQKRSVICIQDKDSGWGITRQALPDSICERLSIRKPTTLKPCSLKLCPTTHEWTTSEWSPKKCSTTSCKNATRNVSCPSNEPGDCDLRNKPLGVKVCNVSQACKSQELNNTFIQNLLRTCTYMNGQNATLVFNNVTKCRSIYQYCKENRCENMTTVLEERPFEVKKLLRLQRINVFGLEKFKNL